MSIAFDLTMFQSEQVLIPFLFILAVVFGAVTASNVFRNKGINFMISLALAFFAASNTEFIQFLWSQFGSISIFFIAMFFIIFTLEAFGLRGKGKQQDGSDAIIINGAILFVLFSLGYIYMNSLPTLPFIGGGQNVLLLISVILIIVIFWSAYKTESHGGK